jgi:hypothetical protein
MYAWWCIVTPGRRCMNVVRMSHSRYSGGMMSGAYMLVKTGAQGNIRASDSSTLSAPPIWLSQS